MMQLQNKKKAFFIVPLITHYRISFYEKLIKATPDYEWLIIDGEKTVDDGRPVLYKKFSFPSKRFKEIQKSIGPFTLIKYEGLYDFVRGEKPDLVIMPAIVGNSTFRKIAIWCKTQDKSLIWWSSFWETDRISKSPLKVIKDIILRRFLHLASQHVAYSSFARNKLIENGIGPEKIHIAYNGLDIEGLEKKVINGEQIRRHKEELGLLSNKVLLYVGGLGKDKMVGLLLQSFASFENRFPEHDLKVVIIGDGPQKSKLIEDSKKLGIEQKFIFLGRIVDDVDNYFQLCDCYVLPGCGGLGLNQAMYWEKPCIVSYADGTEEDLIIDGVSGFRFDRYNAQSLEKAITSFYQSDQRLLKNMGMEGKKIILNQSNVNEMVKTFQNVINVHLNSKNAKRKINISVFKDAGTTQKSIPNPSQGL